MKRNLFLALVVLSANLSIAQTSTKAAVTNTAKAVVATTPKPATSTTLRTTTTTAKPVVKKKTTKSTSKTTTTKKPTTTTTKTTTTTAPTPKPSLNNTTIPGSTTVVTKVVEVQKNTTTTTQTTTTTPAATNTQTRPGADGGTTNTNTNSNTNTQTRPGADNSNTNTNTNNNANGGSVINTISDITQGDAASAIKEALMKGVSAGVSKVSVTDGYFGNSFIKIPFPQDVQIVESTLRSFGMGSMIDNLVLSLNRAAENAAVQAGPIFLNGIKQMTLNDAISIVSNKQPDAATQFLQRTTTESLVSAFKPSIQTALDKTLATKYWSDITGYYNKIPFVSPVNTNLPDYVTRKAITGLFYMVAQEEAKIRKDPINQGSDIINKVFGAFKK